MFQDYIQVKQNLIITARERGKIAARRKGHNIFVNIGREWLAQLIGYTSYGPLTTERDDRIRYMGFGIGGTRQTSLGAANSSPMTPAYAGTNTQTDSDVTVSRLERPVRISGSTDAYPGDGGDVWLGQVQPVSHPITTRSLFSRIFTTTELNYSSFLSVPLSEIMLFTGSANINVYNNVGVAYDTFDTLSKTAAFELEIDWTLVF